MITPTRNTFQQMQISVDVSFVDGYMSDDPEIEDERQQLIQEFNQLRSRIRTCGEGLKTGRIETLTAQREKLIEAARAKGKKMEQEASRDGEFTAAINEAERRLTDAVHTHRSLVNNPPNKTLTTDAEIARYQEQVDAAARAVDSAARKRDQAENSYRGLGSQLKALQQEQGAIERQVQLIDHERAYLRGEAVEDQMLFDNVTGLQVTGRQGTIKSTPV